jgi:hypothetical protein
MLLKIGAIIASAYLLLFATVAVTIYHSGIAVVETTNKISGAHHYIPIPLLFANFGMKFMPEQAMENFRDKLGDHRDIPAALIQEIRKCPDGPFLEVRSRHDNVTIEKSGDDLLIHVENQREDVSVKIPLYGSEKLVAQLAGPSEN